MSLEQTAVAAPPPTFWSSVREPIRDSHRTLPPGNLHRAILLLAIPMVLEMVLESLFAVVDVFWVGRLGADAIATVGLTESLLSLVMAIGFGLSLSTTAMVARRIGEKDPAGAAVAGVQAIVIGVAIAALVGIPCLFYAPDLLRLMGASPQVVSVGSGYARIALGGSAAIMLLFLNNAIFRGAGDAAIAMRLLWGSNIINLVLDPCLIFGWGPFPKLGVTGAALANLTRRRHAGRTKPWRQAARARGNFRVAHRPLQHVLSRRHRHFLRRLRRTGHSSLYQRSARRPAGRHLLAHSELRQHRLCLRHGHAPSLQRCWRHRHTDHRAFLRFLALGDTPRLFSRHHRPHAFQWRFLVYRCRGGRHRRRRGRPFRARPLESPANLTTRQGWLSCLPGLAGERAQRVDRRFRPYRKGSLFRPCIMQLSSATWPIQAYNLPPARQEVLTWPRPSNSQSLLIISPAQSPVLRKLSVTPR